MFCVSLFYVSSVYACIRTICERSYFFDLWDMVTSVFSFPTLLARATYMSYWGGGGREVKRISVNPLFPAPHPWGGGGGGEGAYFSVYTTYTHILLA